MDRVFVISPLVNASRPHPFPCPWGGRHSDGLINRAAGLPTPRAGIDNRYLIQWDDMEVVLL